MAKEKRTPKTVLLKDITLYNIEKKAIKEKRTPHFLMVEALEKTFNTPKL